MTIMVDMVANDIQVEMVNSAAPSPPVTVPKAPPPRLQLKLQRRSKLQPPKAS